MPNQYVISTLNSQISNSSIEAYLQLELQTKHVNHIHFNANHVIIQLNDQYQNNFLQVIANTQIGHISIFEVLHHSATLLHWLYWPPQKPCVIVHIDSHNDLRSPNILQREYQRVDHWTSKPVSPFNIESVKSAIQSTSIEIGSYLTLALYWLPIKALIWICPPTVKPNINRVENPAAIHIGWTKTDELDSMSKRLSVTPLDSTRYGIPVYICRESWQIEKAIKDLKFDGAFLIDIDLDYFDNSLEASHFLQSCMPAPLLTPNLFSEIQSADIFFNNLFNILPINSVTHISIAHSPGFCHPALASFFSSQLYNRLFAKLHNKSMHPAKVTIRPSTC